MSSVKKILALTDFSAPSLEALNRGLRLAKITGASLTLTHALEKNLGVPLEDLLGKEAAAVQKKLDEQAADSLKQLAQNSSKNHGVLAETVLLNEDAAIGVPQLAKTINADLVLLGAHGAGFVKRLFVGSTATRLVRELDRPTLVVRQEARSDYSKLLIAIDFSSTSKRAIALAQSLAPKAKIILLHVFETPFEGKMQLAGVTEETINHYRKSAAEKASRELHQFATACGLTPSDYLAVIHYGDPRRLILDEAKKQGSELIILGKHQSKTAEAFLIGGVAQRVLDQAETDLLVVPDVNGRPARPLSP